jgi:RNA polymerase sigma-70 factor (ECF subfamily)
VTDYVQRSFERFMAEEWGGALGFARAVTGSWSEAEDLTQEAFVAAYRKWSEVARYERPEAFLRRVIANQQVSGVRRQIRKASRMHLAATPEVTESRLADPEFWDAIRQLPVRQRQVVALHYLDDRSVSDIALVLEVAEGTVKAHLHAARHALARLLGDEIEDEEDA